MRIDDSIEIIKPERDSQFTLIPCICSSDNVAYVKYKMGYEELWRVQCFDCLRTVDLGTPVRHQVQVIWNDKMRCTARKG